MDTENDDVDTILDLRAMPPTLRRAMVLEAFAALSTGESFQVVDDRDPEALRAHFADRAVARHEWTCLDDGPPLWRIRVKRL